MTYRAPIADIEAALYDQADFASLARLPAFAEADRDLVRAILGEAGKFASDVLDPLNAPADRQGCSLDRQSGAVTTPAGFRQAWQRFAAGGWGGLSAPKAYGGQGLPFALNIAVAEITNAACMSFTLAPLLTQGAIEALAAHGSNELKNTYLPKLISGEWTGTMNLTEPQAGSDVGALTAKATPQPDGSYLIEGTKIFITYGEHDLTGNIIHLVLARRPDAPAGSRGVSLFLVPKHLDDAQQTRNDVFCIGLEAKLGIHASPTCVMRYGEKGGAQGFLIGGENQGLACMFTMMNFARIGVAIEGAAMAERAFQQAHAFACERKQGRAASWQGRGGAPIIHHPDVRRMLMTIKAFAQSARGLCYDAAAAADVARAAPDPALRAQAEARCALLTPIAKAWASDRGVDAANLGIQIHGGMGFIEETGAAQILRDVRIAPIYEGTNGIQAHDLAMRKVIADGGEAMRAYIGEIAAEAAACAQANRPGLAQTGRRLDEGIAALRRATDYLLDQGVKQPQDSLAGAAAYLDLAGTLAGGHYLARRARRAGENGGSEATALFYAETRLTRAAALEAAACAGAEALDTLLPPQEARAG